MIQFSLAHTHKCTHLLYISEILKREWEQRAKERGSKRRLSRLLQRKEWIPWRRRRLRWRKWEKRGGHSCSLITVMETHPFCQGLQKIFCDTTASLLVLFHINSDAADVSAGQPAESSSDRLLSPDRDTLTAVAALWLKLTETDWRETKDSQTLCFTW